MTLICLALEQYSIPLWVGDSAHHAKAAGEHVARDEREVLVDNVGLDRLAMLVGQVRKGRLQGAARLRACQGKLRGGLAGACWPVPYPLRLT